MSEEELRHHEDNEDHGYDDGDCNMENGQHINSNDDYGIEANQHRNSNANFNVNASMEGVFFIDDIEYEHDCEGNNLMNDEEETDSVFDEDEADHEDIDLSQIEDIVKNYYDLIKQKDRGGLFYPSDSLYRVAIMADIVFTTTLKDSEKKMLKNFSTINRLVQYALSLCDKYSEVLFCDLKEHFQQESGHLHSLLQNIVKFYFKIRVDFLNKNVSANSGKRQKLVHALHFEGV